MVFSAPTPPKQYPIRASSRKVIGPVFSPAIITYPGRPLDHITYNLHTWGIDAGSQSRPAASYVLCLSWCQK